MCSVFVSGLFLRPDPERPFWNAQPFLGIVAVSDEPLATPPYRFVRIGPESDAAIRDWESRSNRNLGSDAVVRLIWVVLLPLSCRIEKWASTP